MVYIDHNGQVLERRPWSVARVLEIFSTLWFIIVQFFRTLFAPFQVDSTNNNRRGGYSSGWGSGGGGGGGGGGGRPGGGGLRPNRRIGRITNSMDCSTAPGG